MKVPELVNVGQALWKKELELVQKKHGRKFKQQETFEQAKIRHQRDCSHLKGGPNRNRLSRKDYNVSKHTFIDCTVRIRCLTCGMKWFKDDTRSILIRNGKEHINHTGLGWTDALKMVEDSTNTPSASEHFPQFKKEDAHKKGPTEYYTD
jgi:hypothetical protein